MNEISYSQSSSTFSQVLLTVGLIAAHLLQANPTLQDEERVGGFLNNTYYIGGNRHTFGSYSNLITGSYEQTSSGFEQSVSRFYAKLLENQEPLEGDFEKVLYANLWDLYES